MVVEWALSCKKGFLRDCAIEDPPKPMNEANRMNYELAKAQQSFLLVGARTSQRAQHLLIKEDTLNYWGLNIMI